MTLVLDLPFREGEGNTVYDQSGKDNHGTLANLSWMKSRRFRGYPNCLDFAGNPAAPIITIPDDPSLRLGTGDFSMVCWLRPPEEFTVTRIIMVNNQPSWTKYWMWQIEDAVQFNHYFEIYVEGVGYEYVYGEVPPVIKDGFWHFLSVVRASGTLTLGVDLISVGEEASVLDGDSGDYVQIGGTLYDPDLMYLIAGLKGLKIFNHALSFDELEALYMQTKRKDSEAF